MGRQYEDSGRRGCAPVKIARIFARIGTELELGRINGYPETEVLSVNVKRALKETLREHFDAMGLDLSGGVRMVLIQYLKANGANTKEE